MGAFFCAGQPLAAGLLDHDLNVLIHQLLEAAMTLDGLLDIGDLVPWNIAGDVLAVFVALVVVIRPVRTFSDNVQSASFQAVDLGDVLEDGLGGGCRCGFCSGFGCHWAEVYVLHIYLDNKKTENTPHRRILSHAPCEITISDTLDPTVMHSHP